MRLWHCALVAILAAAGLRAETGRDAWLRYAPRPHREAIPAVVTSFGGSAVVGSARQELLRGIRGMLGRTLRVDSRLPAEDAIVLATLTDLRQAAPQFPKLPDLPVDAYR